MLTVPALADCVPLDHFGLTCVRDLSPDEVLSRLGVTDRAPYPHYTPQEAIQRLGHGHENPAARVCHSGEWTFLLDVDDHGVLLRTPVLTRLSMGTEAVSIWKLLDSTTRIAHASNGELMAHYDDWMFEPAKGTDPSRLNRALAAIGFFREENEESDEWSAPEMALLALEREFGLVLPSEVSRGPLPTVGLRHLRG
ncbi:hypothetical protein CUT44_21260 [Streptomyces carminius]|uniref:Uncharacterized protein n=1 Tax=Streptomyces carminius TaxID=2665496 RepID=A0A2M8LV04_9ACTN|nr:DUF6461 domain-containing protein [Streptomyces carminius]PJE95788.1 hypothetical protein CUT44_21260 [Streptomyces carminius]